MWKRNPGQTIKETATIDDLTKIKLEDFNQFSSKEDIRRRVAFHRQYTLNGISEFISGLKF